MRWILGMLLLAAGGVAGAAELAVGDRLPALKLEDQFGETHAIGEQTRLLLFTADKAAGDMVNETFGPEEGGDLTRDDVAYIADISGMPSLISKLFALPKLRDFPYTVLVVREAETVAFLPRREDAVTVMHLEEGTVRSIGYADSVEELRERINASPADNGHD